MSDEADIDRIDELCSQLFDMTLKFERAFADRAIDKVNLTDDDAEKLAAHMIAQHPDGTGAIYANLLRYVRTARVLRRFMHKAQAVFESRGPHASLMRADEVHTEYAKLNKGDA